VTNHGRFVSPTKLPPPMTIDRPPPCVRRPELFDPPTEAENREHKNVPQRVPPPNERQRLAIGYCTNVCPAQAQCLNAALAALASNPVNDIGSILGGTTGPQRREMIQVTRYRRTVNLKKAVVAQRPIDPTRCVNDHDPWFVYRSPSGRKKCRECSREQTIRYTAKHPKRNRKNRPERIPTVIGKMVVT